MPNRRFADKKLLVLGSNAGSEAVVNYARKYGAYTIVADYLAPEASPAKLLASNRCHICWHQRVQHIAGYGGRKEMWASLLL